MEESTEPKKTTEAATEASAAAAVVPTEEERPGQANSLEATEAKSRRRRAPLGRTTASWKIFFLFQR